MALYEPIKLPNSANLTIVPTEEFYLLSGLNEIGQPCDVILNIVDAVPPIPVVDGVSIVLPLISSVNFRNIKVTINYNNSPCKARVLGYIDPVTEDILNQINGAEGLPCVNPSGYQVFSVIGSQEWSSLAELNTYSKIKDGGNEYPRRDTLEFVGAGVSISDDALAQKTIVTINP